MSRTVVRIVEGVGVVGVMVWMAASRVAGDISARESRAPWAWSCFATARPIPARPVIAYTLFWKESIVGVGQMQQREGFRDTLMFVVLDCCRLGMSLDL